MIAAWLSTEPTENVRQNMESSFSTDEQIREYLLGRFDDQPELEDKLSQQMLFDDELSEMVDAMEDEIIDSYLDDELSAADKKAVEEYFLRPPQRREKLQFARLLRKQLAAQSPNGGSFRSLLYRAHISSYVQLALIVLLGVVSVMYLVKVRETNGKIAAAQKEQEQLRNQLAQEQKQVAELQSRVAPQVVTLSLFSDFRDVGKEPEIQTTVLTQKIKVEILVEGFGPGPFDVALETDAGDHIWSKPDLVPIAGVLNFEMPGTGLTTGMYRLRITSQKTHKDRTYWFKSSR